MLATLLVVWCLGSLIAAPVIGRAIRKGQSAPGGAVESGVLSSGRARSAEVA